MSGDTTARLGKRPGSTALALCGFLAIATAGLLLVDIPFRYGLGRVGSPWIETAIFMLIGAVTLLGAVRLPRLHWSCFVAFAVLYLGTALVAWVAWIMSWNE